MKKKIILALLATSVLLTTGCTVTKTTEVVETPSTQETTVDETTEVEEEIIEDENVEDVTEDATPDDIEEESLDEEIIEDEVVEDNTYSVSYSKDFEEVTENSDIDNSLLLRCLVDKEHMYDNYIDVMYQDEYTYEEYYEGIALQSGIDDIYTDKVIFGKQGVEADLVSYRPTDDFEMCFFIIPHNDGCYVVETGAHIYGEKDEELGYEVSGAMEEVINSIEFAL